MRAKRISCVMIDDGSIINVGPLRLLYKFRIPVEELKASNLVIKAYNDSKKQVVGTFKEIVIVGEVESVVEFTVLDILPTFTLLLGRPWFHPLGGVPSTLHQKIKFPLDMKVSTIEAETNILVTCMNVTPPAFQVSKIKED